MTQRAPEVDDAIRLFKEGQSEQSRKVLLDYLFNRGSQYEALLWLAKVTNEPNEAIHAAELVFAYNSCDEMAARAIAAVHARFNGQENNPKYEVERITGMTVSQARAVIWTINSKNRPIGVLLDEGGISFKDLIWAAQSSYSDFIKRASRTLLLENLLDTKLTPPKQPAKLIKGFNYPAYLEKLSSLHGGFILGIVAGSGGLSFIIAVINSVFHLIGENLVEEVFYVVFVISLILLFFAYRLSETVERARIGREKEEQVLDIFRATLLHPWVIVSNLRWPNRKWGDVDLVLIGPSGIWAFEVKAYTGQYRNIGDHWQNHSRLGWWNVSNNPARQAQRNAANLKTYLNNHGINPGWVHAVVIWAGESDKLSVDDPAIPVWKIDEIQDRLEELWGEQKLSEEQVEKVAEILEKAVKTKEI